MRNRLVLLAFPMILALVLTSIVGCGNNVNIKKKELIREGLIELREYSLMLQEMNPKDWGQHEQDLYFFGDYKNIEILKQRIREARKTYNDVVEACRYMVPVAIEDESLLIEVSEELDNLRMYDLLGAEFLKTAIDLIERDISQGNNTGGSMEIVVNPGDVVVHDVWIGGKPIVTTN